MNAPPDNEPTDNEIVHRWQGGQSMRGIAVSVASMAS